MTTQLTHGRRENMEKRLHLRAKNNTHMRRHDNRTYCGMSRKNGLYGVTDFIVLVTCERCLNKARKEIAIEDDSCS